MTALIGALLIGIMLGLMGSGGSILTVPLLVYLLGHHEKVAIAESLAIVGGIALAGMLPYAKARQIDWRSVAFFGVPGMAGTFGGAWLAKFVTGPIQLVLFAVVMLLAAWMMYRRSRQTARLSKSHAEPHSVWKIVPEGLAVGVLTGLVGVGGGFLIVPALVILGGLSMRLAVGTSLAIITLTSASGFFKYLDVLSETSLVVDWGTIALFVAIGTAGTFLGKLISSRLNQHILQKAFAAFLLAMAAFVLTREIPHVMPSRTVAREVSAGPTEITQTMNRPSH